MKSLRRDPRSATGCTVVIANLHTLDTARRYCDRVVGMRDGRIVFDGLPEQLTTGRSPARSTVPMPASRKRATSTEIDTLDATQKALMEAEATI